MSEQPKPTLVVLPEPPQKTDLEQMSEHRQRMLAAAVRVVLTAKPANPSESTRGARKAAVRGLSDMIDVPEGKLADLLMEIEPALEKDLS